MNYMQFSSPNSVYFTSWLIVLLNFLPLLSFVSPRLSVAGLLCGQNRPVQQNTNYSMHFFEAMDVIESLVTNSSWGYYAVNKRNISIYALAQCYQHLAPVDCYFCYRKSQGRLVSRCLPALSGRVYLDGCFLRYDKYNFFDESVDPIRDATDCRSSRSADAVSVEEVGSFGKHVSKLINDISIAALKNGGFAVKGFKGVFGLAQCWKTLSKEGCKECLATAGRNVKGCLPSREGRGLNAGCYLRYSTLKFYNDPPKNIGASKWGKRVAIASSVVAFSSLSLFAAYVFYARFKKFIQERRNLGRISRAYNKSYLYFKYEILEKATNYFDPKTKIGQGGAGSVHRGTLPDGKVIAVKRLFFNTREWVDVFFNEVDLVNGIQHKNLVKLLGCSIEGPESLLVYEFVPNKSLDHYLFDENKIKILSWRERFQIIFGIAEGIAFLHGGAEIRVVHRDIKSSNVLLDEDFSPKIADFGLARHFAEDKTHLSTGLAGTLGYMAPEYLVKGQLTEKADVYSFGILVLEVVCGRKQNASEQDSSSLLPTVWKFYKMEKVVELVDPCLEGDFPTQEAWNVLRIGLLCAQASSTARPSMDEVVHMLTDFNCDIPEPNQPPFLNANSTLLAANSTNS